MSDLNAAKLAIEAELVRAEQGLQFYVTQVESLKSALAGLAKVEEGLIQALGAKENRRRPAGRASQTARSRNAARTKSDLKAKAETMKAAADLPITGSDYWLQYIGNEPRTAVEITAAAIAALGFIPTPEQVKVLKQRVAPSLDILVRNKRIKDTGAGRSRRFSLAHAKAAVSAKTAAEDDAAAQHK